MGLTVRYHLPCLTLPCLTLPCLTLPCLTLPALISSTSVMQLWHTEHCTIWHMPHMADAAQGQPLHFFSVDLQLQRSSDCENVCDCRCLRHLHCLPRRLLRVSAATITSQAHLRKMQQKVITQTRKAILSKMLHREEALASVALLRPAEEEMIR